MYGMGLYFLNSLYHAVISDGTFFKLVDAWAVAIQSVNWAGLDRNGLKVSGTIATTASRK